jgi:hypothetical protein
MVHLLLIRHGLKKEEKEKKEMEMTLKPPFGKIMIILLVIEGLSKSSNLVNRSLMFTGETRDSFSGHSF